MRATTIITAIWLPIIRNQADYDLLPEEWKVTGVDGFAVHRASVLEKFEATVVTTSKARKMVIDVVPVKATPQYMQRALMDRVYNVATANTVARLLAMSPGFDANHVYDV